MRFFILMILILTTMISCMDSSESLTRRKQEELSRQSVLAVGMPAITKFSEKKHLKDILELRDSDALTITYVRDVNGKLHKLCDSIGFGIPYATQFTNPLTISIGQVIPQADPNGLFSPSSADATWVLCLNPKTKKLAPMYVEDRITVSTFELE